MPSDGRQVVHKHIFFVQVITFSQNVRFSLGKSMKADCGPFIVHSIWHPSGEVAGVPGGSKWRPFGGFGDHFGIAIATIWATWGPSDINRLKAIYTALDISTTVFSFKMDIGVVVTCANFLYLGLTGLEWPSIIISFAAGKRHSGPNVPCECCSHAYGWPGVDRK